MVGDLNQVDSSMQDIKRSIDGWQEMMKEGNPFVAKLGAVKWVKGPQLNIARDMKRPNSLDVAYNESLIIAREFIEEHSLKEILKEQSLNETDKKEAVIAAIKIYIGMWFASKNLDNK